MSSSRPPPVAEEDWDWLHDNDSTSSDDISIDGIGVLAVHLHHLKINESFSCDRAGPLVETFRICVSAYALTRYSKTARVYLTEKRERVARFDQTMHLITRIYDKRRDRRHLLHVILYGYLSQEKRYARIADQVIDCIRLVSARHVSEAVVFESAADVCGKATLLIELAFVYGRHGYNFSSQLIFQSDIHLPDVVKGLTLFERTLPIDTLNKNKGQLGDQSDVDLPILLKLSFDELSELITDQTPPPPEQKSMHNFEVIKALAKSSTYSSMTAIVDMHPSRKQRLETLFGFLSEGPYLPERNVLEPSATRLIPWSIAYWKRGLAGLPLEGNARFSANSPDFSVDGAFQSEIAHVQNTSPALRQMVEREEQYGSLAKNTTKLELLRDVTRRVLDRFSASI